MTIALGSLINTNNNITILTAAYYKKQLWQSEKDSAALELCQWWRGGEKRGF